MNFFSVLFIILLKISSGKIISDKINTNINWIFLTKFSFHPIDGYINMKLNINDEIKLFALNKNEWKNDLLGICLKEELVLNQENNQTNLWSLSKSFTSTDEIYFILSNCNSSLNIFDGSYTLILTNGNNLFTKHFSNNKRAYYSSGILGLFIVSTYIYIIFFLIILRYIYISKTKSCLIIKFYLISILCSWLNSLISLIYTLIFALTGYNDTFLHRFLLFFAQFFHLIAQILFLLILILCVNGYLIIHIQLKKKIILQIKLFILLYILIEMIILIINTIITNRKIVDENILMICNCIEIIIYFLSYLWFILSILLIMKKFYSFFILSIWFLINGIVLLLNIFENFPNPQITITKIIQITIQLISYCIFWFLIRNKTFFLQTKLNQINIIYIDPTLSKSQIKEQSMNDKELNNKSNELINLCLIENTWASRFRLPIKSLGPLPRLEPRRDILTKSSVISVQPSMCPVPRRLPPVNPDDQ